MVRCKACGFLMEEGKHHHCPACGVPEKMFEPWEDKIPANRRMVLNFHIHPIVVHMPQALGFILFLLAAILVLLLSLDIGADWVNGLYTTQFWLTLLLPIMVAGGVLTGLLDGKYRYKTVTSSLLIKKIILGSSFLVLAGVMAVIVFQPGFKLSLTLQLIYTAVNLLAFLCSAVLGLWGAALTGGIMGGPFTKKKKAETPLPKAE